MVSRLDSNSRSRYDKTIKAARGVEGAIFGKKPFPEKVLIKCATFFEEKGWNVFPPTARSECITARKKVSNFLNKLDPITFTTMADDFNYLYTIYRTNTDDEIKVALVCAFLLVADTMVCYIEMLAVGTDYQRKGFGEQTIYQIKEFLLTQLKNTKSITNLQIILGMSRESKPHAFYKKLGFIDNVPAGFESWIDIRLDMAYLPTINITPYEARVANCREIDKTSTIAIKQELIQLDQNDANKSMPLVNMANNQGTFNLGQGTAPTNFEKKRVNKGAAKSTAKAAKQKEEGHKSEDSEEDVDDDGQSTISYLTTQTNKTKSGHVHKHCLMGDCDGKLFNGDYWSKHTNKQHQFNSKRAIEGNNYTRCGGSNCIACTKGEQGYNGPRDSAVCATCGKNKRLSNGFPKGSGVCNKCTSKNPEFAKPTNKTSKSMIVSHALSECNVKKLGAVAHYTKPEDIVSLIGSKRLRTVEEDICTADGDQLELVQTMPLTKVITAEQLHLQQQHILQILQVQQQQRQQLSLQVNSNEDTQMSNNFGGQLDDIVSGSVSTVTVEKPLYVSNTDQDVIDMLNELETSQLYAFELAQRVQKICRQFTQGSIKNCIAAGKHPKLIEAIIKILQSSDELEDNVVVGLSFAALILGNTCWASTVDTFKTMDTDRRDPIMATLALYIESHFNKDLTVWLMEYWRQSEQQHLDLIQYLKSNSTGKVEVDHCVLTMSLAVTVSNIPRFVQFASDFYTGTLTAGKLLAKSIAEKPKQLQIIFEDFGKLTEELQMKINAPVIEFLKEKLTSIPISQWVDLIGMTKKELEILNVNSVEKFLGDLGEAYGKITDPQFKKDLLKDAGLMLGDVFDSMPEAQPNAMQFAYSQFSVYKLYSKSKLLCVVPSGQGKQRISFTLAIIGIKTGLFTKAHMVFSNKSLMERDIADFADTIDLLELMEQFAFHCGVNELAPKEGELVIVDECDQFMLTDPLKFSKLVADIHCVGFTATPGDSSFEKNVLAALQFQRYDYVLEQANRDAVIPLPAFDQIVNCTSLKEKAEFIMKVAAQGPVALFCNNDLTKELIEIGGNVIMVDENVDHRLLGKMHVRADIEKSFSIAVAESEFGMRGINYRSTVRMTQIIAKSFSNGREAIQGLNRVGRFNDHCTRVKFNDVVDLVDRKLLQEHNKSLLKFAREMQTNPPKFKPLVLQPRVPNKKNAGGKMQQSRFDKIVPQLAGQQQLSQFVKK